MKIGEVEAKVGISKKNIRFYEEKGLINPQRNRENRYREYDEKDVETLRRIILMRKLGISLEEIRRMRSGEMTVADTIRRHLVTMEQQRKDIEEAARLCQVLKDMDVHLDDLDVDVLLGLIQKS